MSLGYNTQTYKDRFLYLLEGRFKAESSEEYTDALIFSLLNDAQVTFQSVLQVKREICDAITSVAGTPYYTVGGNALGTSIQQVLYNGVTLKRRGFDMLWLASDAPQGTPTMWAPHPSAAGQIVLYPTPAVGVTDAIQVLYVTTPRPFRRLWNQTTITASVSAASTAVTLSATGSVNVIGEDEFGVPRTTQSDGQAVSGESPVFWYKLSTVNATALVLGEAYGNVTAGAVNFITAQVSDLEMFRPGRLGFALAEYAAAKALMTKDPETAARLGQAASAAIAGYAEDVSGYIFKDAPVASLFPQLFVKY